MELVTWTRQETGTTLAVRILSRTTGYEGEPRLRVCKETADPRYCFTVRAEDVSFA